MTLHEFGLDFLRETPEVIEKTVAELSPNELTWKPSETEFSALEHVCHLRDIEREGYQERIRRLLEEDAPYLPDIDGSRLALERKYSEQELGIALEEFARVRQENVETILGLGLEQLDRGGNLEGVGWITLRELLELMRAHDEQHREELRNLQERINKERNPFLKIRARGLLLWFFYGLGILFLGGIIITAGAPLEGTTLTNFSTIFIYTWILYGVFSESEKVGVDFRLLLRRTMSAVWLHLIGIVLCLITFSFGSIYLFGYLLTYIWPGLLDMGFLSEDTLINPNHSILNQTVNLIRIIVIAPVIEEILFRGFILNRWITKWGMQKGILATSLAFAFLHINVLSMFLFALCMAILYLKTRSLLFPIAAHALNNLLAVALGFLWPNYSDGSASAIIDAYRSAVWFGVICFALSLPILVFYINRNWPKKDAVSPYFQLMKERSV